MYLSIKGTYIVKTSLDLKKNYCYLLSPFITALVLIVAYIVGNVYPFGTNTVAYFDMAQRFIPNFYHIWDAIHKSDVSLWFNWYSGLGVNDTADASFSFFWLVLAVLPRRLVGKAMSLYVVLFFSLASFSASLFLRKAEKAGPFITTMLSICYAFCGYSVMYYTNTWLDSVVLFPLLMLSWLELLNNDKKIFYIILVFLNFQCNYYIFVLSLLSLFFISFLYLAFIVDKAERKRTAMSLGFSTLCGILLSGFSLVPKLVQTFSSGRFVEETGFDFSSLIKQYTDIANTQQCEYPEKITMLFLTAFPIALIILGIARRKSEKKENAFYILNILLMVVPIICEGTNLLMHLGDYKYFPMRTGYILSFAVIWAAGHFSKYVEFGKADERNTRLNKTAVYVINAVAVCGFFGFVFLLVKYFNSAIEYEFSVAFAIPIIVIAYILIIKLSGNVLDYKVSFGGLLAEIVVISLLFIPYWETSNNTKEKSPAYIQTSQSVSKKLSIENSKTERVKTIGTTLNCNYGTIINRATIADWTHLIPSSVNSSLEKLGYSGDFTRIHDSGGTAFTDALLGVTNVLSVKEESPALYEKINSKGGYKYYKCRYTIPYGIVVDRSVLDINTENLDWMELNNKLYTCLSEDSSPIVTDAGLELVEKDGNTETYEFTSKNNSVAYFRLRGASSVVIYVNDKKIQIPSVDTEKNKKYPAKFNRNLIYLGEFDDGERVEIKLVLKKGKYEEQEDFRTGDFDETDAKSQYFSTEVGLLDLDKLDSVCKKYRNENNGIVVENYSLKASVSSSEENKVLLLPLQYNGCWSANVNDNSSDVNCVIGLISAVDLTQGKNDVSMKFTPTGFKEGLIVSALGLSLLVILILTKKCNGNIIAGMSNFVYIIYCAMFYFGMALIYVIPLGMKLIYTIRMLF